MRGSGFTLIEIIGVVLIIGLLLAIGIPRFVNLRTEARIAAIKGLEGSARSALAIIGAVTSARGTGSPSAIAGITFFNMNGTPIRLWNGYPDRWWDGIGQTQASAQSIAGGGYLSTAAVAYGQYTFYGFGSAQIAGGNAGWRIESAPTPANCSVAYIYNGAGVPTLTVNTSGC